MNNNQLIRRRNTCIIIRSATDPPQKTDLKTIIYTLAWYNSHAEALMIVELNTGAWYLTVIPRYSVAFEFCTIV